MKPCLFCVFNMSCFHMNFSACFYPHYIMMGMDLLSSDYCCEIWDIE